jgi:hypothetical protein
MYLLAPALAGVSRPIQDKYRRLYENKALFLKIPLFSEREIVPVSGRGRAGAARGGPARFKVGDQVRVTGIDFGNNEIRFRVNAISGTAFADIAFRFESDLLEEFPNSELFEAALRDTFTEGLKYADLEDAKRGFVEDAFDRMIADLAATAGTSKETVLKTIAPDVPAYQEAQREITGLRDRTQTLSSQLAQLQAEHKKMESELRNQQAEGARLRNLTNSLQEKIDTSTSQLSRLGEDLRTARGLNQGYQKELANLQRTLNLKVDANRDLGAQIAELGQVLRKLQKDNETLQHDNGSLRVEVEDLQSRATRLTSEVEDVKGANQKMRQTIATLTSKEDSLARQYIELKETKENLENVVLSVGALRTSMQEQKNEGGLRFGKTAVYLGDILLGVVEWRFPERLSPQEEKLAEASFSSESIDYVRVQPQERHILRSLGDRMKVQLELTSGSASLQVQPETDHAAQVVGERDRATWRWRIVNRGTQDGSVKLQAALLNKNSDKIPVMEQESLVLSSSMVRQVRNYLQPIPMAVGVMLGAVLFGIAGVFRRGRRHASAPGRHSAPPPKPDTYVGQKRL